MLIQKQYNKLILLEMQIEQKTRQSISIKTVFHKFILFDIIST